MEKIEKHRLGYYLYKYVREHDYDVLDYIIYSRQAKAQIGNIKRKFTYNQEEIEDICISKLKILIEEYKYPHENWDFEEAEKIFCGYIRKFLWSAVNKVMRIEHNSHEYIIHQKNDDEDIVNFFDCLSDNKDFAEKHAIRELIINILKQLPWNERFVIFYYFIVGETEQEIAEKLKYITKDRPNPKKRVTTVSAVCKIKNRAIDKLRLIVTKELSIGDFGQLFNSQEIVPLYLQEANKRIEELQVKKTTKKNVEAKRIARTEEKQIEDGWDDTEEKLEDYGFHVVGQSVSTQHNDWWTMA
ncbi:hypothetical protein EDC14_100653 [Hydrogenispora ethanolica]|uniref:Sigma-70 family RNA polymerase sigma factor n=1 Tax=Hydrogenispora ethanolica TaxID=1082276 RepID=A0A4R1RZT6_HYDET|nr:sigma-70 family RNA polymerase sigma factor [Hydrogenispora ethanolica]TCL72343.1 hypothetical protein EDC14_100653 [Hydrogenispora ethanolica]